ncbi:hypothetical protein Bbelb_133520 [Branchiostoma belcheri]|nr:hypothetical protein Bbelb_133520 [Branchiostoma belcheri]
MDSPGYCAQYTYCTYIAIGNHTKSIVAVEVVDKRETNRNSTTMEKEVFKRTMDRLLGEGVPITEVCTDAHPQITALMNQDKSGYGTRGFHHSLDVWHGAKNLTNKIVAVKGCTEIKPWTKDIVNHFWWCCKKARNYEEFIVLWRGVLHHVCDEHTWATGSCHHEHLSTTEPRTTNWLAPGSAAHKKLSTIVLNKRWLKTASKYLHVRFKGMPTVLPSTGPVYSFQLLLKFLHFADNTNIPQPQDPNYQLYKVQLLIEHFQHKFLQYYYPHQNISINESMVGYKRKLPNIRQFMPNKRHSRFGMKLWCLSDSTNGYLYHFKVYKGARGAVYCTYQWYRNSQEEKERLAERLYFQEAEKRRGLSGPEGAPVVCFLSGWEQKSNYANNIRKCGPSRCAEWKTGRNKEAKLRRSLQQGNGRV